MNKLTASRRNQEIIINREDPYLEAMAVWLEGKPASTHRAYQRAIQLFFQFAAAENDGQPVHPRDVSPGQVAAWKQKLTAAGLSPATIAQRLSGVSSYYYHLMKTIQPNGEPLHLMNPVIPVTRPDVMPYGKAKKLPIKAFKAIMAQIDTSTPMGARDAALFKFYAYCGRRRVEAIRLYGRDIRQDGDKIEYQVKLKGGKITWKGMPGNVWEAISHYLCLDGRQLVADEPIFTATVDRGGVLDEWRQAQGITNLEPPAADEIRPLSVDAISQALKRYAKRAGLDEKAISVHSLRHLAAELVNEASGGNVRAVQTFLDHANLNTTQIYLNQLEGQAHPYWKQMMAIVEAA